MQKETIELPQSIIPAFNSGSSTHAVAAETTKRQAWKTLKLINDETPYKDLTGRGPAVKATVQGLSCFAVTSGFTLIELLVVVLIIGILAAIALPQYQKAVLKSRFTKLVITSKSIVDAQRAYYMEHGVYANRADLLDITFPLTNGGRAFGNGRTWSCIFNYANGVGGDPRTSCDLFSPRMTLQWYHTRPSAICCVYASNNFAGEWLCQEITKKTNPYQSAVTSRCYSGRR